jgi:starch synthase
MPRYRQVEIGKHGLKPVVRDLQVPLGAQTIPATIFEGRLGDMVVYFVDCPQLYDREGMYGFGDDDARSVYFSRALLDMLPALQFTPDVIQVHEG